MSFLTDIFEGHDSNLGNDITHAGSSLINHPDELAETLGGAAALATGGLALGGGLGALGLGGAAEGAGGILTGGDAIGVGAGDYAAASTAGASAEAGAGDLATANAISSTLGSGAGGGTGDLSGYGFGSNFMGVSPDAPTTGINDFGPTAPGGGDVTGTLGGSPGTTPGGASTGQPWYKGIMDSITNPTLGGVSKAAGIGVAGGLLGYDLLKGNPTDPNQKVLQAQAGQLSAQGQQLESYLQNGTLPPALQAQLKQATDAEKARIISGYASRGQPTDPNQNSALAQELNAVDTNAIAAMAQTQIQLLNTGINETGMSTQLYETLVKLDQNQNQDTMKAIASFAAALGGGGGGTTLKLAA